MIMETLMPMPDWYYKKQRIIPEKVKTAPKPTMPKRPLPKPEKQKIIKKDGK